MQITAIPITKQSFGYIWEQVAFTFSFELEDHSSMDLKQSYTENILHEWFKQTEQIWVLPEVSDRIEAKRSWQHPITFGDGGANGR